MLHLAISSLETDNRVILTAENAEGFSILSELGVGGDWIRKIRASAWLAENHPESACVQKGAFEITCLRADQKPAHRESCVVYDTAGAEVMER